MLDKLLLQAKSMGASDLHLTPEGMPMVRVDGSLQPLQNEIISREKLEQALLALLPEQEKRQLLQTGEIDTAFSDRLQERCRLNIYRLGNGYAAAIVCSRRIFLTATVLACRKLSVSLAAAAAVCCSLQVPQAAAKAPRWPRWYSR